MFAILMLCGMSVGLSQLKVSPVMAELATSLGVTLDSAAWLMSVFTIAGVLLSIPGAGLLGKLGTKNTLLFLVGSLVAGNVLGAVATSFSMLFVSRVIEGIAAVFAVPVGVDFISRWFSGPAVGTATGIYMTATPIATFLANSSALPLANALGGIKSLWWIVGILDVVCFVLTLMFVRETPRDLPAAEGGAVTNVVAELRDSLGSKPLTLLCVSMFFLSYALYSLITCYPQLFTFYGLPAETSNLLTSLNGLIGIPMSIISGIIIGKTGKPYYVAFAGAAGALATCATLSVLGDGTYAVNVIASAVFPAGIAVTPMFVLGPLLVRRSDLAPMGTCLMNTVFYLGQLVSTPLTTALTNNNSSWTLASIVLSISCVLFFVFAFLSRKSLQAVRREFPDAMTQAAEVAA